MILPPGAEKLRLYPRKKRMEGKGEKFLYKGGGKGSQVADEEEEKRKLIVSTIKFEKMRKGPVRIEGAQVSIRFCGPQYGFPRMV